MPTIAILGTLDTKGAEHAFVAEQIRARGHQIFVIDVGIIGEPGLKPDITRAQVAQAAGANISELVAKRDRGEAVTAMTKGAAEVVAGLAAAGRINGIISLGGGGGTAIGTAAMRVLPIGFPKVMVSTLASGNTAPYVGVKDILMFPSIVDIAGLNRISRPLLARAAGAVCGMVETQEPSSSDKPIIVASQFGNTTACVDRARQIIETAGFEVVVFAAVGTGGRTMESLLESGLVSGVLDVTTTEWADELVGGVLNAGPTRLEAAARKGIPAVVSTGCLDMVNFGPPETVPGKFKGRRFYQHNPQITLMRTTPEENSELAEFWPASSIFRQVRLPCCFLCEVEVLSAPQEERFIGPKRIEPFTIHCVVICGPTFESLSWIMPSTTLHSRKLARMNCYASSPRIESAPHRQILWNHSPLRNPW